MDIAANIRRYRELRGLSQDALAAKMQLRGHQTIDQSAQAKIEAGTRNVSAAELLSYARILRVKVTEILGEPDYADENS